MEYVYTFGEGCARARVFTEPYKPKARCFKVYSSLNVKQKYWSELGGDTQLYREKESLIFEELGFESRLIVQIASREKAIIYIK